AAAKPPSAKGRVDLDGDPLPPGAVARLGSVRFRHRAFVASLAFSPDGRTVASGDGYRIIRLWEAATGKEIHRLEGHIFEQVYALAFSPDGTILASGGGDRTIRLWEVATGKEVLRIGKPIVGEG